MPKPKPTFDDLINEYPPDVRDDLSSLATRMEFQLNNFIGVAGKRPFAEHVYALRNLFIAILNAPE